MAESYRQADFDFDYWASLAANDPQAFEKKRIDVIEQAIGNALPGRRQRLRCLQWKLDTLRRLAPDPLTACIRFNALMWDSVTGPEGLLERLQCAVDPAHRPARRDGSAQILPFRG